MRKISVILIIFISNISFCQNETNSISEKIELKGLLVSDIEKSESSKVYFEIQNWDRFDLSDENEKLNFLFSEKNNLDSIFNSKDKEYMRQQILTSKSFTWDGNFENRKVVKKRKGIDVYSIPLFSVDRNFAIVYKEKIYGPDNGNGCYYIYKWILNEGWIILKTVNCWMN